MRLTAPIQALSLGTTMRLTLDFYKSRLGQGRPHKWPGRNPGHLSWSKTYAHLLPRPCPTPPPWSCHAPAMPHPLPAPAHLIIHFSWDRCYKVNRKRADWVRIMKGQKPWKRLRKPLPPKLQPLGWMPCCYWLAVCISP